MTNKELAAQCLIEAANILNDKEEVIEESYGAHGVLGKTLEDMYKKEKAKNDNYEKNSEKKRKMYERAGFGDKVKPVDRTYENDINYIGQIGYYYEGNVWIGKSGKFYSIHEYEDTIRVFNSIWELLEWELSCHEFIRVGIGYYL